jgi:hypothetical protein
MNDKIEFAVLLNVNQSLVRAEDAAPSHLRTMVADPGPKARPVEASGSRLSGIENIERFCPPGTSITVENAKRLRALSGGAASPRSRKIRTGMLDFTRYA